MVDTQGGLVRFTMLRRNHTADGVYQLVAAGDVWIPERGYSVAPATHVQPDASTLTFSTVTILATGMTIEAQETVATVLTNQAAGLAQTRPIASGTATP